MQLVCYITKQIGHCMLGLRQYVFVSDIVGVAQLADLYLFNTFVLYILYILCFFKCLYVVRTKCWYLCIFSKSHVIVRYGNELNVI